MIALRDVSKYSALSTALELRFGDENLKQVFAVKLKTTVHKVGESLQEFCSKCQKNGRCSIFRNTTDLRQNLLSTVFATLKLKRCYKYLDVRR